MYYCTNVTQLSPPYIITISQRRYWAVGRSLLPPRATWGEGRDGSSRQRRRPWPPSVLGEVATSWQTPGRPPTWYWLTTRGPRPAMAVSTTTLTSSPSLPSLSASSSPRTPVWGRSSTPSWSSCSSQGCWTRSFLLWKTRWWWWWLEVTVRDRETEWQWYLNCFWCTCWLSQCRNAMTMTMWLLILLRSSCKALPLRSTILRSNGH